MVSYTSTYKNEIFVIISHGNRKILIHRVWEGSGGEDWSFLFTTNIGKFMSQDDVFSVTLLEVHYVGRVKYILLVDTSGKIKVFKEDGKLYGSGVLASRPLVFLKQRLMFLTENNAGSLDLRGTKIKESECEGLNHYVAQNYVFDANEFSKAYGITLEGDLIHVLLLGDVMNFKCRVRKFFVYNVSSLHYVRFGVPRLVFSSSLDNMRLPFLNYPAISLDAEIRVIPLIASDGEKLDIVGLGGGSGQLAQECFEIPEIKEKRKKPKDPHNKLNAEGLCVKTRIRDRKGRKMGHKTLTSWGLDSSFSSTSATTSAPLASGDIYPFIDSSSRNDDVMDIRGGSLRPPTRRYGSSIRYHFKAASSYRLGSAYHNRRPPSVDPVLSSFYVDLVLFCYF
ncbi:unnamed protein product [Lupinus luteus]|uniref:Uncharacterized protein n=1 Tax=Lupinus luteus TaxID=3873 RepID=A0AAV1YFS1_LUPLU